MKWLNTAGTFLMILIFVVLIIMRISNTKELLQLTAEKGEIDLTQKSLDNVYLLNGEWGTFDHNSDLQGVDQSPFESFVDISKFADNRVLYGSTYYKLHVKTDLPLHSIIAFKLTASYACRLYVDNQQIFSYEQKQLFLFSTQSQEFDIIVLMSDDVISAGNQIFRFYMGAPDDMQAFANSALIKKELIIGALIIIFVFFSALSQSMRNVKYTQNFSIICFLIAIIIDSGDYRSIIQQLSIPINTTFVWYSAFFLLLCFTVSFLKEMCPSPFAEKMTKIATYALIFEELGLLLTPIKYIYYINQFSTLLGLVGLSAAITIVVIGIIKRNQDAWSNMLSIGIALVIFVHDVIFDTNVIDPSKSIFLYAIYMILIIQMMIQARKIKSYHEKQLLAELSFLQAQIKPHFLHNVLNTVISVSRYNIDQARELLYNFNNYLRNSFNMKNFKQLVELKQEICLVEDYLKIEKARFEERLEFEIELPDNLDYLIPPLMLQPIIENAINHGVLPKPEGGKVYLRIIDKNRKLEFHVKDNGIGMRAKQINMIMFDQKEGSIGLANIQSRLKMLYDEELTIKSTYGLGTEISWQIPLRNRKGYYRAESYNC